MMKTKIPLIAAVLFVVACTGNKKEVKEAGDNDPIGILLVTNKNEALVEYATAGMDKNLFVSKYLLQLPSVERLESFIRQELKNIE